MSGTRGERQDLTLPSRSALHERPKPFAVHLGSAYEAEASRRFSRIPAWSRSSVAVHLGSLQGRSPCSSPVDPCSGRSLRSSPEESALAEASATLLRIPTSAEA